jgi:Tol biopolymer transport system component
MPGGTRVFYRTDTGTYSANADGTSPTLLASTGTADFSPVASPDGTRTLYISKAADSTTDVWVMNADGSNQHKLSSLALVRTDLGQRDLA